MGGILSLNHSTRHCEEDQAFVRNICYGLAGHARRMRNDAHSVLPSDLEYLATLLANHFDLEGEIGP